MEFYLTYRGRLKANGKPKEKQAIRREFHKQLKALSGQPPLREFGMSKFFVTPHKQKGLPVTNQVGQFKFAALVSQRFHLIAELEITLLRPEPPGSIVTQAGDIDNRLKTLLDSLKTPRETNEIPANDLPKRTENPFFCLLEDDNLITKLSVETGRLLEARRDSSFVSLLIRVQTKATELTSQNLGLA